MTDNPFDALGGGGFDMNALLQQAQQMQEQLQSAQEQLADARVEGSAGGAVTVTVSGVGDLLEVSINPGIVDGADTESLSDLSDLIVAAYRQAKGKADEMAGQALGPLAGGLPGLPGDPGPAPGRLGF